MPIKVHLTQMLVRHLDIEPELSLDASNLEDLFNKVEREHPGFMDSICDETGRIRTYVNVFVNGDRVEPDPASISKTSLIDRDEVHILASVAGGTRLP